MIFFCEVPAEGPVEVPAEPAEEPEAGNRKAKKKPTYTQLAPHPPTTRYLLPPATFYTP